MPLSSHLDPNLGVGFGFTPFGSPNDHLPCACEFQGVSEQVGQDLPQTSWITAQPVGDIRLDRAGQLNAISVGACGQQVQGAFNHFDQVKIEHFEQ